MHLGHRIALTFLIVIVILFGLALFGCWTGRWEEDARLIPFQLASAESRPELPCMDVETREAIKGVMVEALDVALKQHIVHAFEVWMKDPTGQPERARVGTQRAIKAYIDAKKGAIDWAPPLCAN